MIHSYKRFFKALAFCVDKGYDFELRETCLPLRRKDGLWVFAYVITCPLENGSQLSPISLVHHLLINRNKPIVWVESVILKEWGFEEKGHEIREATNETGYHDPEIRAKLLDVCGLKEKSQHKRRLIFGEP